ncbi:DUF1175 family protein [Viridibacterium curvum]|uniref:DUF1175 domain-containing protein n=1 Tax=Viridibacterium curvum TaxID=1101404 RepID=A0ABP9QUR3_9RHOO
MNDAARRRWLAAIPALAALLHAPSSLALRADGVDEPNMLDREQSRRFRAWLTWLVREQLQRGPNPRWTHRDCAGLVRFAVAESLNEHNDAWRQANGVQGQQLPPPLDLSDTQRQLRHRWITLDGKVSAFVTASALITRNTRLVSREYGQAEAGDLLFFDQGDDQHLMVCMGGWIAYHTGTVTPQDNGLRATPLKDLLQWKDTRWRPISSNPNFAGVFRLSFLAP